MIKKLRAVLLYENLSGGDRKSIMPKVMEENREFAVIWSLAEILYWAFCIFMSTRNQDYRLCRDIYIISFAVAAASLLLALFISPKATGLIRIIEIMVDVSFLGAGIGIARLLAPKTIVIFASVLVVPVFFICDSLSTFLILTMNVIAFSIAGKGFMDPEPYSWTMINLIIFSTIGLVLGYFVNKDRFERFYFADSAMKLAELQTRYAYYDQLTGLQNRRAYSELTDQFSKEMPAYCCVVMADINGLKEMNDTIGHEAGDELIAGSAECLRTGFQGIETIYRLGGDEFGILITDRNIDAERCLKRMEEICSAWKGRFVNGISISYGFASSEEFPDFESVQKAADQRMYAFKSNYYISSGKNRRKR